MKTADEKKAFLQGLQNIKDRRLDERQRGLIEGNRRDLERSKNLARGQLDKDVLKVSRGPQDTLLNDPVKKISGGKDYVDPGTRVGGTDKIDTKQVQKLKSGEQFQKDIADKQAKSKLRKHARALAEAGDTKGLQDLIKKYGNIGKKVGLRAMGPAMALKDAISGTSSALGSSEFGQELGENLMEQGLEEALAFLGMSAPALAIAALTSETGPEAGSLEAMAEDPSVPLEQRIEIMKQLREKYMKGM